MFNSSHPFPRGLSALRTSPHTFCISPSYPFSFLPHSWVRSPGERGVERWTFYGKNISILSLSSEWWSVKLQLCCSSGIRRNQTSQWLLTAVLMYKIYQRHSFSKLRCLEGSINVTPPSPHPNSLNFKSKSSVRREYGSPKSRGKECFNDFYTICLFECTARFTSNHKIATLMPLKT